MRFIDLFAGIGGFRLGIQNAQEKAEQARQEGTQGIRSRKGKDKTQGYEGLDTSRPTAQQHSKRSTDRQFTCVYTNEWDKYAAQIYEKHFGEVDTRDITTVPTSDIPQHDLLCAGFPCQAFSVAGKRKGFDDTRGTLFFDIARILKDKRPRYLLLENVKGLLSHEKGKTFQTILGVLTDLGYDCQWQVLNSKDFGVPQNRERVFIVGHLRGTSRPKVFPIGESDAISGSERQGKQKTRQRISSTIDSRYGALRNAGETYLKYVGAVMSPKNEKWLEDGKIHSRNFPQGQRVYSKEGIGSTIAGNAGGLGGKTGLYEIENMKIRRLTPTECERLQGFLDGWTEGVSDTQRYKMLGNAVTVNVVEGIIERFFNEVLKRNS